MFRKNYYLIFLTVTLVLISSLAVFAQTTTISGRIELKNADGTTAPVAGVSVEVFRIDKKVAFPAVKTDDKGSFTVSGIPNEGEYVVSVSGEKINPEVSQPISAGNKDVNFAVSTGDGKKYSEEQIRLAVQKSGELTPEQKKEREDFEASKKKVENSNATVEKVLQEGSKAFDEKNYDVAIAKFEEGYQASPDFIGHAPGMLNNKGLSLSRRAVFNYNKWVQSKDPAEKTALKPKITKDFEDAIEAYSLSWKLVKNAKPDEIVKIQKSFDANKNLTLTGIQEAVNLMNRTESISEAKKTEVIELMREYLAAEKDPKKKSASQLDFASYLLKANDYDNAIVEYRKAVALEPNNPDAVGGLGLSLWTATYGSEDTARKQEALNYMQYFLDIAPKDHKLVDGIEGGVADLKSQKLTPKKVTAKN